MTPKEFFRQKGELLVKLGELYIKFSYAGEEPYKDCAPSELFPKEEEPKTDGQQAATKVKFTPYKTKKSSKPWAPSSLGYTTVCGMASHFGMKAKDFMALLDQWGIKYACTLIRGDHPCKNSLVASKDVATINEKMKEHLNASNK